MSVHFVTMAGSSDETHSACTLVDTEHGSECVLQGGVLSSEEFQWCFNKEKKTQTHSAMDPTKLFGEACTPNGGLKEAHEIEWVNDPDDATPVTNRKSAGLIIGASYSP